MLHRSGLLLLSVWYTHVLGQLQECLVQNEELDGFGGATGGENEFLIGDIPGVVTCNRAQGLRIDGQVITIRVESTSDIIGQNEDFGLVTAYDASCDASVDFGQFRFPVPPADLTWNPAASCPMVPSGEVCDLSKIPLAPPTNTSRVCVRLFCDNTAAECDLTAYIAIEESVDSSNSTVVCSVNRQVDINSLAGISNTAEFTCGGSDFFGLGSDDLENGAVLSYNIRTIGGDDDTIRVYHARGDSCGNDPDDEDFEIIAESSCASSPVESCSYENVTVPAGGPDCIVVACENSETDVLNRDCELQVEISWTSLGGLSAAGRPVVPALFIGALAIMFTVWL